MVTNEQKMADFVRGAQFLEIYTSSADLVEAYPFYTVGLNGADVNAKL